MAQKFDAGKINTNLFPTQKEEKEAEVKEVKEAKKSRAGVKRGPYLPPASKRSVHINIAITPDENERLRKKVAEKGITISTYIQQLVVAALEE